MYRQSDCKHASTLQVLCACHPWQKPVLSSIGKGVQALHAAKKQSISPRLFSKVCILTLPHAYSGLVDTGQQGHLLGRGCRHDALRLYDGISCFFTHFGYVISIHFLSLPFLSLPLVSPSLEKFPFPTFPFLSLPFLSLTFLSCPLNSFPFPSAEFFVSFPLSPSPFPLSRQAEGYL